MSLINQVLKDLEQRRAPERRDTPRPVGNSRRRHFPLAAWWIIAAVGIGAAMHWLLATDAPSHPTVQPEIVHAAFETGEMATTTAPPIDTAPEPSAGEVENSSMQTEIEPPAITGPAETEAGPEPEPDPLPVEPAETNMAAVAEITEPAPAPPEAQSVSDPEAASSTPTISIQRAGDEAERSGIDSARRAIARGHHQQAERGLRQLLEEQPDHDEARGLLASDLVRRNRLSAAIDLLEQGLGGGREPARFAYRLGRILIEQGQVEQARNVLEAHAPPPERDPDFQQLLAAAHRQAGDHVAAEAAYRRLTEIAPQRAAAWVGLGVSLEALDRVSDARGAYAQLLEIGDPQANRFARQRLRAIQDSDGDRS